MCFCNDDVEVIAYVVWTCFAMMRDWMMLGDVVSMHGTRSFPKNVVFFVCQLVAKPVETHIPRFRALLGDVVMRKTISSCIVGNLLY